MRIKSTPLLSATEEQLLAREIEAGVLARHLLCTGERPLPATAEELREVADAGERAWHRFLLSNVRLVWKLAGIEARRSGLPVAELFQEGFVALAGSLQRYDADRGRFTTYAITRIRQHLAEVGSTRLGGLGLPPSRAIRLRRARALESMLGQERGGRAAVEDLAEELGAPAEATRRLVEYRPPVGLDSFLENAIPEAEPRDPDAAIYAGQVRRLLVRLSPEQAQVIALRYGFVTGDPLDQSAIASRLGISLSTVRRLEKRAMATLRPLAPMLDPHRDQALAG